MRLLYMVLVLLSFASCSADSGLTAEEEENEEMAPSVPAQIVITTDTLSFASLRQTEVITAVVLDEDSVEVPDAMIEWTTSDQSVVSLEALDNRSVRARAISNGEAFINVSTGGLSGAATAIVEQKVANIRFIPDDPVLELPGDTLFITAIALDALNNAMPETILAWDSPPSSSVSVNDEGLITAQSFGTGTVSVESGEASFTLNVEVVGDRFFLNGETRLRYLLRLPTTGNAPVPALIFIHGSGMITRQQLSPFVTQFVNAGVAVLLYDKRGVGESTGNFFNIGPANSVGGLNTLASDVAQAARFLRNFSEIDSTRIGVIANSQGGWLAPLVANMSSDISYMMMWSGPTVSVGLEIFYSNLTANSQTPLDDVYLQLEEFNGVDGFSPLPVLENLDIPGIWLMGGVDRSIPTRLDSTNISRLQAQGKPYEFVWYPTANHELRDTQTGQFVDLWSTYLEWMSRQGIR